jgi:hypothetical protein
MRPRPGAGLSCLRAHIFKLLHVQLAEWTDLRGRLASGQTQREEVGILVHLASSPAEMCVALPGQAGRPATGSIFLRAGVHEAGHLPCIEIDYHRYHHHHHHHHHHRHHHHHHHQTRAQWV